MRAASNLASKFPLLDRSGRRERLSLIASGRVVDKLMLAQQSSATPPVQEGKFAWTGFRLLVALSLALTAQSQTPNVPFADISKQAGIQFVHNNGAAGKKYLPETLGSGVVFLDFNNDGLQDL